MYLYWDVTVFLHLKAINLCFLLFSSLFFQIQFHHQTFLANSRKDLAVSKTNLEYKSYLVIFSFVKIPSFHYFSFLYLSRCFCLCFLAESISSSAPFEIRTHLFRPPLKNSLLCSRMKCCWLTF